MDTHGEYTCNKCGKTQSVSEFHKDRSKNSGHAHTCKTCVQIYRQKPEVKERLRANAKRCRKTQRNRDWRKKYDEEYLKRPDVIAHKAKKERTKRLDVIKKLGGKCECCGEDDPFFLAIDHINGKTQQERERSGGNLVNRVVKEGYPKDTYRVLCHNCNSALGFYGFCPHQEPGIDFVTRK